MEKNKSISYSCANEFPIKTILDAELINSIINNKKILPRHLQLIPTNKCSRDHDCAAWCSCSKRTKTSELTLKDIIKIITKFKKLKTSAITISGGGEPLLHKDINQIIDIIFKNNIKIGLVTNADFIDKLKEEDFDKIVWVRLSLGDNRKIDEKYWDNLCSALIRGNKTVWGFSYVIDNIFPDIKLIEKMVKFSNFKNIKYIRFVGNILNAENLTKGLEYTKNYLKENNINDEKVIYQDRAFYTKGNKNCRICLVKPIITADKKIDYCCGIQYASNPPLRDFLNKWGTIEDIEEIWEKQIPFRGDLFCEKCYYEDYNKLFEILLNPIDHKEFI